MDWQAIIKDLIEDGYTQTQLAIECGVGQTTVSDLARGASTDPSYSFGRALNELHERLLKRRQRQAKLAADLAA